MREDSYEGYPCEECGQPYVLHNSPCPYCEADRLRGAVAKWKRIRTPTCGPCCTCQACGLDHDSCRCDLDDVADDVARLRKLLAELVDSVAGYRSCGSYSHNAVKWGLHLDAAVDAAKEATNAR